MVEVDKTHDVHWLAGYNVDGDKVYVDKHMPDTMRYKKKNVPVVPFLEVHELTEKHLMDELGLTYEQAHEMAEKAEKEAVEEAGISWKKYDGFMQKQIKLNEEEEKEHITDYPKDLEDPEHPGKPAHYKAAKRAYKRGHYTTALVLLSRLKVV